MLKIQQAEEAAAAGPEINVDDEGQLRREYNTITKDFRDVQSAFGRIRATDPTTAAGQISLVFQYMKMLDPGSTVREGEFATAENARGVPEGVMNTYNKIMAKLRYDILTLLHVAMSQGRGVEKPKRLKQVERKKERNPLQEGHVNGIGSTVSV
jgi:hypothetical protein